MVRLIIAVAVGVVIALGGTVLVTNVLSSQADGTPMPASSSLYNYRHPLTAGNGHVTVSGGSAAGSSMSGEKLPPVTSSFPGESMRRDIGAVLAGLGTLLIVMAVVRLPTVASWPQAVDGSRQRFEWRPDRRRRCRATYPTKGVKHDRQGSSLRTAVWNEFSYVYDTTNHRASRS